MKYVISLMLLLSVAVCQSQQATPRRAPSQSNEQVQPPKEVLDKFTNEFPNITPAWHMDGDKYVAEFMEPMTLKASAVVYDKSGNVIRRENEVENSSYPQSINDFFIKQHPGEKFRTWSSVDQSGKRSYFIKRSSETLWFDGEGKHLAGN